LPRSPPREVSLRKLGYEKAQENEKRAKYGEKYGHRSTVPRCYKIPLILYGNRRLVASGATKRGIPAVTDICHGGLRFHGVALLSDRVALG
jgi:hypothetical protein